jgi:hypothetical protein
MRLEDCVSKWAKEAGLPMDNDMEAHIYAASVSPAGVPDIEITPEEEPACKAAFLKILRECLENPEELDSKVSRQISSN